MQSRPAGSSSVKGPDVPIWLRFNVRVDGKRSRVSVTAPDGAVIAVTDLKQTAPDTLESQVTGLKPGVYRLHWQVLASDGHISRGDVGFTVN
jgi:methionine-rich copper-binding protein CopC